MVKNAIFSGPFAMVKFKSRVSFWQKPSVSTSLWLVRKSFLSSDCEGAREINAWDVQPVARSELHPFRGVEKAPEMGDAIVAINEQ